MSGLRLVYILSLLILAVLVVCTVLRPMAEDRRYSEVCRLRLIRVGDDRAIEFDIINREGKDTRYTINLLVDGKPSVSTVFLPDNDMFTYVKHINRDMLTEGKVTFTVHKEGEATPFEDVTYYLK